jgi:hypothetical protein
MITNKIAIGGGALALAVTASLTPLVAQAEPGSDTDSSSSSSDSSSSSGNSNSSNSDSSDAGSASSGVGNAAGRKPSKTTRGGAARPTVDAPPPSVVSGARPATAPEAAALGPNPLLQNPLWWFGTPNPDAPPPIATRTFEPLASLPGWAQGYYGWYRDLNFEACVLGLSNTITPSVGPYGTSTSSVSSGGC